MRSDKEGMDNGKVSIDIQDNNVVVGRRYSMKITYTAGPRGVSIGGSLRFRLPSFKVDELCREPIECSNPRAKLKLSRAWNHLFITVEGEPLKEGDTVSVFYGYEAPTVALKWRVEVATDLDGKRGAPGSGYYLVRNPPTINFVSDRAVKLETTIPSTTKVGEPFEVTVRARDRYNNVATGYRGRVRLESISGRARLPESYVFKPEDQGVHTFKGIVFETPGINRIIAIDEGYGLYGRSNPTKTMMQSPTFKLYWGDTHVHSCISADSAAGGITVTPEEIYAYARNVSDLDFCMVTDHNQDISEAEWRETQEAARKWYEPSRFVTFSAFECTHKEARRDGDRNVYYFTDDQPLINKGTTKDVFNKLKGKKAMVIPHMHAGINWELHDPELERVVEVYSHWGCGLSPDTEPRIIPRARRRLCPENYVHYALDKGIKVGFIASADHSLGHPGDDFWWPLSNYQGGLAAVYSKSLTREGIWEALRNRRCYATTRARILLEFEINGHVMGEEFTLPSGEARHIFVSTSGTTSIERVEIIKNGRVIHTRRGGEALDINFVYIDKEESERRTDYYYVQVMQVDGERAWSSPIWVVEK